MLTTYPLAQTYLQWAHSVMLQTGTSDNADGREIRFTVPSIKPRQFSKGGPFSVDSFGIFLE